MATQAVDRAPLSKFAFCDIILDSALELDKARAGRRARMGAVRKLAEALSRASRPFESAPGPAFVEPIFYDSFERLFRVQRSDTPESVEEIQAFVGDAVDELRAVESGTASEEAISRLVDFCVVLHKELAREIEAEESGVLDEWRTSDVAAPDSLC